MPVSTSEPSSEPLRLPGYPSPEVRWTAAVYLVFGLILLAFPLVGLLHVESAAAAATLVYFVAGSAGIRSLENDRSVRRTFVEQYAALGIPLALLTASLLWRPNCGYLQGLLFYVLFPGITLPFALSVAYFLTGLNIRFRLFWLWCIGACVIAGGVLYDLGLHPQFYTYNHIFGGILGPIYDVELAVRPGLFWFRGLTAGWSVLLFLAGCLLRRPSDAAAGNVRAAFVVATLCVGATYAFSARFGINTPAWLIAETLGKSYRTEHFTLYFDPATVEPETLHRLAQEHEYRYARLAERLGVEPPGRIDSYLYPDPETRARLTGALYTNVAPVWLSEPQMHILLPAFESVFSHELVHVFSREFAPRPLRAPNLPGLVEGLAVAFEAPTIYPSVHEQVLVAGYEQVGVTGLEADDMARDLAGRLTAGGFWTGRGTVSYTTMGSFIRYLTDRYGVERIKVFYRRPDFQEVFGTSVDSLASGWVDFLASQRLIARDTESIVNRRFTLPSLFEVRCPHYVPPYVRLYRKGERALADGDTVRALKFLHASLEKQPGAPEALGLHSGILLIRNRPDDVLAILPDSTSEGPLLQARKGDAHALLGNQPEARRHYSRALQATPYAAEERRAALILRKALADSALTAARWNTHEEASERSPAECSEQPLRCLSQALRAMETKRYEPAYQWMQYVGIGEETSLSPGERMVLNRQQRVWLARLAYLTGRYEAAAGFAQKAAYSYRRTGAINIALALDDFVRKMQWIEKYWGKVSAPANLSAADRL